MILARILPESYVGSNCHVNIIRRVNLRVNKKNGAGGKTRTFINRDFESQMSTIASRQQVSGLGLQLFPDLGDSAAAVITRSVGLDVPMSTTLVNPRLGAPGGT